MAFLGYKANKVSIVYIIIYSPHFMNEEIVVTIDFCWALVLRVLLEVAWCIIAVCGTWI